MFILKDLYQIFLALLYFVFLIFPSTRNQKHLILYVFVPFHANLLLLGLGPFSSILGKYILWHVHQGDYKALQDDGLDLHTLFVLINLNDFARLVIHLQQKYLTATVFIVMFVRYIFITMFSNNTHTHTHIHNQPPLRRYF